MSNGAEQFEVLATTPEGEPYADVVAAGNSAEVVASLRERGLQVSRVRPVSPVSAEGGMGRGEAFAAFNEMLASLTRHDVPLPEALRVLAEDMKRGRFRRAVQETADRVERGMPLHEAMEINEQVFPALYRRLVAAGAKSGRLTDALLMAADHARRSETVRSRVQSAVVYPAVVFAICLASLGVYLALALPGYEMAHAALKLEMPFVSRLLAGASAAWPWLAVGLLAMAALVWVALRLARRDLHVRRRLDLFAWRIPAAGPLWRPAEMADFCRTLCMLLKTNVPMPEALRLLQSVSGNAAVSEAAAHLAAAAERGEPFSDAILRETDFPRDVAWQIASGEASGRLAESMELLAASFEERTERLAVALEAWLEIAFLIALALLVVSVFATMLWPFWDLLSGVWMPSQ